MSQCKDSRFPSRYFHAYHQHIIVIIHCDTVHGSHHAYESRRVGASGTLAPPSATSDASCHRFAVSTPQGTRFPGKWKPGGPDAVPVLLSCVVAQSLSQPTSLFTLSMHTRSRLDAKSYLIISSTCKSCRSQFEVVNYNTEKACGGGWTSVSHGNGSLLCRLGCVVLPIPLHQFRME